MSKGTVKMSMRMVLSVSLIDKKLNRSRRVYGESSVKTDCSTTLVNQ